VSTADTITREELTGALKRRGLSSLADYLFDDIVRDREPEYEPGGKYEDPDGVCFERTSAGEWITTGSASVYAHDYPDRPLRRLVPERPGIHLDQQCYGAVLGALADGTERGDDYTDLAARVMNALRTVRS
jgi:hypothetical protein